MSIEFDGITFGSAAECSHYKSMSRSEQERYRAVSIEQSTRLVCDSAAMVRCLRWVYAGRPTAWAVSTINPNAAKGTRSTSAVRMADDGKTEAALLAANDVGGLNSYFITGNPKAAWTGPNPPLKPEIESSSVLFFDKDFTDSAGKAVASEASVLEDIRAAVQGGKLPQPGLVINTGGGVQAFWRFPEPMTPNDAEGRGRYIVETLGGDSVWNCNRQMRIGGGINWPSKAKRERGRVPVEGRIISIDDAAWAKPEDFQWLAKAEEPAAKGPAQQGADSPTEPPVTSLDDPRLTDVPADVIDIIRCGKDAAHPTEGERDFYVACQMAKAGCSAAVIKGAWRLGEISADAASWPRGFDGEMDRIIRKAQDAAVDADLATMNEKHCVVSDIGGKCVVLNETVDPATSEAKVTFSSFEAFGCRYGNRRKVIGKNEDGSPKMIPLSRWWYWNPKRRQVEHVVFAPGRDVAGTYNLWPGFSVAPDFDDSESKCALYVAHIRDNICKGDAALYQYVINWMADAVQSPGRPGGTALVLRGRMGIGKGVFANQFGKLFGRCFIPVTKAEHIGGKFNAHMGEAIVLFADECFFPGNPQHEQILKVLVTERQWLIERKGIDAVRSNSCLHIILACNNEWAVPVGADDRRYPCIEVGDAHMRDRDYFQAIERQMGSGGREALLGFLLRVDLTGFNAEDFPRTVEHDHQRALSRHGVDALVEELCHEGRLPWAEIPEWPDVAVTTGEQDGRGFDYFIRSKADSDLRRLGPTKVKAALKDWACSHWRESKRPQRAGIQFPPLKTLRAAFEAKHGPVLWRAADVKEWETTDYGTSATRPVAQRREAAHEPNIPF